MNTNLVKVNELYLKAMKCRQCFDLDNLEAPAIDIAQPRWVGEGYWDAAVRILILMLNPGSGESRKDTADSRFRDLLHAYTRGDAGLDDVFARQQADIPNWGRKRLSRFYFDEIGLELDEIALGNIAWCATKGNVYPSRMLRRCFEKHTSSLVQVLRPDIILLSGSATHSFASQIREILPDVKVIETIHYAHRHGRLKQASEVARIRELLGSADVQPLVLEKRLELINRDGKRTAFSIQIGQPYASDRCWKCPVGLVGLPAGSVADICGEDAVQALCLAVGFAKMRLGSELKRENRIVEPDTDIDWPMAVMMTV